MPEDTTRENILAEAGYEQTYDTDEIITRMPAPAEIAKPGIRLLPRGTASNTVASAVTTTWRYAARGALR